MESLKSVDKKEKNIRDLKDSIDAVIKHFEYEEDVLNKVNYEDLYNHEKRHTQLIKKSKEIISDVEMEILDVEKAVNIIFDELIVGHILCEDIKFYPYFENSKN